MKTLKTTTVKTNTRTVKTGKLPKVGTGVVITRSTRFKSGKTYNRRNPWE